MLYFLDSLQRNFADTLNLNSKTFLKLKLTARSDKHFMIAPCSYSIPHNHMFDIHCLQPIQYVALVVCTCFVDNGSWEHMVIIVSS